MTAPQLALPLPSGIRTLADIEAIEAVPLDQRYTYRTTTDVIMDAARRFGDRTAIRLLAEGRPDGPVDTWSFRRLAETVARLANLFHDLGVTTERPVSYLLPNLPETQAVIWGAQAAGAVNAINPMLSDENVAHLLRTARSRVVVAYDDGAGGGTLPVVQRALALLSPAPSLMVLRQGEGLEPHLKGRPADLTFQRSAAPDDVCAYFHTGGTTGLPKLARHTHANEIFDAWGCAVAGEYGPEDVILVGLPMFHVNAVIMTGLAALMSGAEMLLLSPQGFRDKGMLPQFWRIVETFGGTIMGVVPTVLSGLMSVPTGNARLDSLRYAICGGAPMAPETFRRVEETLGLRILEAYGLSEAVALSAMNPARGDRRIGSVGLRYPYQTVRTVHLDGTSVLADCAPGEVGHLILRGPNVGPGYTDPERNASLFTDDGWLITGDLARLDPDGYVWLAGRSKDVIIRSGHNIDPSLIEDTLTTHPDVLLCAAVGRPDAYAGEIPVAFVTLRAEATVTAEELTAWARDHIAERPAAPATVCILPDLPTTAVGKIFKPALRAEAACQWVAGLCRAEGVEADVSAETSRTGAITVSVAPQTPPTPAQITALNRDFASVPLTIRLT